MHAVFDPVSNREHWVNISQVRDKDSDELIDLSAAVIVVAVRHKDSKRVMLHANTADGTITIEGLGYFKHVFTDQQMRTLYASEAYEVGCTIQLNGIVQQFYIGTLPVLDGIIE